MKVTVKKVDAVRMELNFEVSKERVSKKLEEVYKDVGKSAKVKGFRPGKVPRNVLESQYGELAREEVMKSIIPEVYQEGLKQESIVPLDFPDIADVNYKDGVITFVAKLEIKPEVTVKDYKGLKIKRKSSEVTDEEINKTLDYFKQGAGNDKDKKVVIDDEFAKGLGYPSLEDFKKSLSHQIGLDKDRQNRADIENQIVESLLKKAKLAVPQSLVAKQLAHRVEEQKKNLKQQGIPEEEILKKEEDFRKELMPAVEKDIKAYLVFDKIAQLEKIEVKEGENLPAKVIEFLLKEAKWEGEKK